MSRKLPEWIGTDGLTKIPQRVKIRVAARSDNCCSACGIRIRFGGEIDHAVALINGGEHREANLRLLCKACHAAKSKRDVAEKSKIAQVKKRMGPLKREQSEWSKKLETYRYNWKRRRYEPIVTD